MNREPMVYGVAGVIFGFVLGYMAANAGGARPAAPAAPFLAAASGGSAAAPAHRAPVLDPNEVRALESLAARDVKSAEVRVELGNLLMDHERFEDAVRWYQEALALDPSNSDVRVDMGASFVSLHRLKRYPDDPQLQGLRAQVAQVKASAGMGKP